MNMKKVLIWILILLIGGFSLLLTGIGFFQLIGFSCTCMAILGIALLILSEYHDDESL